ncbi:Calcium-transporting ATPase 2 [Chlorella vulgaris]
MVAATTARGTVLSCTCGLAGFNVWTGANRCCVQIRHAWLCAAAITETTDVHRAIAPHLDDLSCATEWEPEWSGRAMAPVFPAWSVSAEEALQHHGVQLASGLSSSEVEARRSKYGFNELEKAPGTPLWKLILEQFDDTLVKILLLAAAVSFGLALFEGEAEESGVRAFIEPLVIVLILVLNAAVGVWQESNAENALEALKEMTADTAKVFRDGQLISDLPARELLPGDVVEIHTGDKVPADIRVVQLKTAVVRVEQAALTGESVAVAKSAAPVELAECELQAKECMLFAGTGIASGACLGLVNSIGMATEIGQIQAQIQEAAEEESDTPLKRKLDEFGEALAKVILYICVAVWLINYRHFLSWKSFPGSWIPDPSTLQFSVAVALAVAAIPEGLPAVITTCLALGTRKMAKRNAIVRRLPSVETLGCTTVICSDKTGTLTTNQMSAVRLVAFGRTATSVESWQVTGSTYDPDGGAVLGLAGLDRNLEALAEACALCNDARIEYKQEHFKSVGQPTEAALLVLAEKLGVAGEAAQRGIVAARQADPEAHPAGACVAHASKYSKLATLEFDRDRKSMSVICSPATGAFAAAVGATPRRSSRLQAGASNGGGNVLYVKGAAECVLARCNRAMLADGSVVPLDNAARKELVRLQDELAAGALRLLAFAVKGELAELADYNGSDAHRGHSRLADPSQYSAIESDLVFLGLAGLQDPPRPEVRSAIQDCHAAGIRVMVITGDNKLTAEAICRAIGVFGDSEEIDGNSMTGLAFAGLPDADKRAVLSHPGGLCFSRAEPRHKQDIVRLLKEMGEVTAMTGDGVNDAPALKLADIGVAMGITGTEVAKEASDMVLADDNFATVVAAVEEGRAIYNNMKAFIRYMISSNIGEVASIFLAAALGLPEGLIPVQLLWVNLVTDGPPATALGFNPADPDIMTKPPRRADDHFITPWIFFRWMVVGCYVGFATVGSFATWYTSPSFLGIDLSADGHTPISLAQLRDWESCPSWKGFEASPYTAGNATISFEHPCDYFTTGKVKASTLSLSVLVVIEMLNAMNALSEDNSLLQMPVWRNPWLLVAMVVSLGLHAVILYVPLLADIFSIVPLSFNEWLLVLAYSAPVILLDEVLKFVGRNWVNRPVLAPKAKEEQGDVSARLPWYASDWNLRSGKLRILAAATYIFLASAIPAIAFGEQLYSETDGLLSAVQVLAATAITGVVQAVVGGQPLLIVGVAEPIVLVYKYMYDFAKDQDGLGPQLFLAWCGWTCVWASLIILVLAVTNTCRHIDRFTRFAGELFGALIALLFIQQAVKGTVEEFRQGAGTPLDPTWQLVNGLWSLFLACALLLSALALRRARSWRFLKAGLRGLLADYGSVLVLVAISGLSFAVGGGGSGGGGSVPRRVQSPNTWDVRSTWTVAGDMGRVEGKWIAGALIPAALIAILFYFDHNVSSQLAQQEEFNLQKPSAYHWDMLLLGLMTLLCGLLGMPPVNGVLPQSPMHTKALTKVAGRRAAMTQRDSGQQQQEQPQQGSAAAAISPFRPAGRSNGALLPDLTASRHIHPSPTALPLLPLNGTATSEAAPAAKDGNSLPPSPAVGGSSEWPPPALMPKAAAEAAGAGAGAECDTDGGDEVVPVHVYEQRVSGLLQSLGVGACLAAMPAIRQIPTAALWGYFAFMALESLPGSQLWDRTLLLATDPHCRPALLEQGHAPYLETVPFRVTATFTTFQLTLLLCVYALTWAPIAGILFPVPILLLVPLRHRILPRFFRNPKHLNELDAAHQEEAEPLSREQALEEAASQGLAAAGSGGSRARSEAGGLAAADGGGDGGSSDGDMLPDCEVQRLRVLHHLSHESLTRRRQSLEAGQPPSPVPPHSTVPPPPAVRLPGTTGSGSSSGSPRQRRRSCDVSRC